MPETCGCKHRSSSAELWENCGDACSACQSPPLPPPCLVATAPIPIAQILASGVDRQQGIAHVSWASAGMVIDEREHPDFVGAPAQTNNTGELSAMLYMIRRAATRRCGAGREVLHTDSLYARNMTTGKWVPRRKHRNTAMIERLRREWRELQRQRPHKIELVHVRSQTRVPGNEIADWLAERGSSGTLGGATRAAAPNGRTAGCASMGVRERDGRGGERGSAWGDEPPTT